MIKDIFSRIFSVLDKFVYNQEEEIEKNIESLLSKSGLKLFNNQVDIIKFLFQSNKRFKIVEAPTGSGKTISYLIYSLAKNFQKILISVSSKALQQQIEKDLSRFTNDFVIIMGKNNYICNDKIKALGLNDFVPKHLKNKVSVSSNYCREEYRPKCEFFPCQYFQILERASQSQIVIVNHSLLPFLHSLITIPENSILIIDEAHLLPLEKSSTIKVSEEDFKLPEEPKLENFSSLREYNIALEEYLDKLSLLKSFEKNGITSPGVYTFDKSISYDFSSFSEVLFFSATAPDKLPVSVEEVDELRLSDNRSWSNVTIIVENINYKMKNYNQVLLSYIRERSQVYDKVIILATNSTQLDLIEKEIGCPTTLSSKPFSVIQKMISGEAKIIAGTDIFWTGIDIPGRKCIIMTKLPFPVPDGKEKNEEQYILAFSEMFKKFKQGIGRMLRSPQCGGEIIVLDNRVKNYPDIMSYLQELEKKGSKVIVK